MRKEFKYITVISIVFCMAVMMWAGLQMPWNEEAALYAVYGGSVGFYAAIVMNMFIVWKMKRKQKKTR